MLRLVQTRLLLETTGTLRTALLFLSCCGRVISSVSDGKVSYRKRLRNGITDIKADDAVDLFQDMIRSRPLPAVIDFNRLFGVVARTKQYDLVLALSKQMELIGVAYDLYTLNIVINCFCRCRKVQFAYSVLGKVMKFGYESDTTTFNTLLNGLCLEGRVPEAVELVDRMIEMGHRPDLITINTLVNGLCLNGKVSEAVVLIDRMVMDMLSDGRLKKSFLDRLS
ncbi:PREDICTED: pentatricopeptide repeat-containing protein At1g12620-like [Camelina sativa]|uniref:Pentatricopeptide repeat-containing protein At1g12620-like n=1 Tax=Camelina sativa TaxID=90675 RepID=A0ABM0VIF7_CAMSA|nr:PREDICTED: pentatricopeptide repeat-containing protein At1g12620-like [Camelina sativa]